MRERSDSRVCTNSGCWPILWMEDTCVRGGVVVTRWSGCAIRFEVLLHRPGQMSCRSIGANSETTTARGCHIIIYLPEIIDYSFFCSHHNIRSPSP